MAKARWITQAAAIPYRVVGEQVEVLLVTSRAGGRWTVPKGGIKAGASPEETAAAEALEEAGVTGRVEAAVGQFAFEKAGDLHRARAFPLRVVRVLDRWQEEDHRLRIWVPIAEVGRFVTRKAVLQLVITLRHRLLSSEGQGRRARLAG
jgi:8-oxo-dGTP pyrophosphatase MutT (NUDIX family)